MKTKEYELIARVDRFKFQTDNFVEKVKKCNANRIISESQYIVENYHELDREISRRGTSFEDPLLKKLNDSWRDYINYAYKFDHECICKR
jgi:hypothetical protein